MRLRTLAFGVAIAIAIGSLVLALVVSDNEGEAFDRRQGDEALRAAHQAEAVAGLSVGQLGSAAAFFRVEREDLTGHEFEAVADSLLSSGALIATALIQSVPDSKRRHFEAVHGFPITERNALGQMLRATDRPRYFPVAYAASATRLAAPLGYDVASNAKRSTYLWRARDSGAPAATPVMRLPIGVTGINVFHPIYREGAPTATSAERRAALIGFAGGAFRLADLASAATEALSEDIEVQLLEEGEVVVGSDEPLEDAAQAPVRIADRSWVLVVRDPSGPGVALPVMIVVFGMSLAGLLAALILIGSRNERMRELQRQASQDPLTRLKNRRRFEQDLRTELARSRRDRTMGALLVLDLDLFKQVNDTLGHPTGDRVIEEIADVLVRRTRETDVLARVGGDEFAIVLADCDGPEAQRVGEEIATAIREHVSDSKGVPPITVSVGIALFGTGTEADFESVQAEADAAMYAAKAAGRDGVRISGSGLVGEAVAEAEDPPD